MPRRPAAASVPSSLPNRPFRVGEALALGYSESTLETAQFQRPTWGMRVLPAACSESAYWQAILQRLGGGAFLCSATAARCYKIPLPQRLSVARPIHVAVRSPSSTPHAQGLIGHRLDLDDSDVWASGPLRLTTPGRTWCDLAAVLEVADLVAAGDALLHLEHATADSLAKRGRTIPRSSGRQTTTRRADAAGLGG